MQALILAAGMGQRLSELTSDNTKCMVEVNGVKIIDRLINQLSRNGIGKIIIVTGYKGDNLKDYLSLHYPHKDIVFVENEIFDKTNNIYSLWLAHDFMEADDTVLIESDLIFQDDVVSLALSRTGDNCALVARYELWMDGTMVLLDGNGDIEKFIPKKEFNPELIPQYYKTVNVYTFSRSFSAEIFMPAVRRFMDLYGMNDYYEMVLSGIVSSGAAVLKAVDIDGLKWYEIDNKQDLEHAEELFAGDSIHAL